MAGQKSTGLAAVATVCAAALGCSAEVVDDPAQAEGASTHALITIARHAPASAPEEARADAFAGFLRTPGEVDAAGVLRVAGLGIELPRAGECKTTEHGAATPAAPLTRVELLDAGEVTLAAGGSVTTLAMRAFPTVTDSISGVVYTTRDRASAPLPAASAYTFATSGGSSLGPVSGEGPAPAALAEVALDGVPLGELESLRAGEDLKLTWAAGVPGDRVYVELDADSASTVCAFRDEAGQGSIAGASLPAAGTVTLAVHRLRESAFADQGLANGQLRFDFELSASVSFE
jgi:hypothetical protein